MKITKELLEQMIREAAYEYLYGVKNPSRVANQYKLMPLNESEAYERAMQVQAPPSPLKRTTMALGGLVDKLDRLGLPSRQELDALAKKSPEELAAFDLTHDDLNKIRDFGYSQLLEPGPEDFVPASMVAADGPLPIGDAAFTAYTAGSRGKKLMDMFNVADLVRDTAAIQRADQDTSDTGD